MLIYLSPFSSTSPGPVAGYFAGGYVANASDKIEMLDFDTESCTKLSTVLAQARSTIPSVYSTLKAYFCTGNYPSAGFYGCEAFTFVTKTIQTISTNMFGYVMESSVSSLTKGYVEYMSFLFYALTFSTQTATQIAATLPVSVVLRQVGTVRSATKGYFCGGYSNPISDAIKTVQAITFSTETTASIGNKLVHKSYSAAGVNSALTGYIGGGSSQLGSSSFIDGLNLGTEASLPISATLQGARQYLAGCNSLVKGYFAGGDGSYGQEIDGIDFTTNTAINPSATLSDSTASLAGTQG